MVRQVALLGPVLLLGLTHLAAAPRVVGTPAPEGPLVERKVADEPADRQRRRQTDQAVQAQLGRRLPEINFDRVGLTDVVDFLRDVTNANIFINWKALEAAGVERNAPVTVRLKDVAFGKALDTVLKSAGGDAVKLAYAVDDGVITVSTADDLAQDVITRVYDVRDLVRAKAGAAGEAAAPADEARFETVTRLVTGSVAPGSWRDRGGTTGSVRAMAGQLIVTQTAENHEAIANLLAQTRKLMGLDAVEAQNAPILKAPEAGRGPEGKGT